MKTDLFLAAVLVASASLALDITTTKGVTYSNVTVKRVEPDGVSITHSTGITKIMFNELTPEDRERFHLSADKARAYNDQRRGAVQAGQNLAKLNEARRRFAEAFAANSKEFTLKCWRSDEDGVVATDSKGVDYFIPGYEAMPGTWFKVTAVPQERVKLNSVQSAIRLLIEEEAINMIAFPDRYRKKK